jgi:hypothetical protein
LVHAEELGGIEPHSPLTSLFCGNRPLSDRLDDRLLVSLTCSAASRADKPAINQLKLACEQLVPTHVY